MEVRKDSISKWLERQKNKCIIHFVHMPLISAYPGESCLGWYVREKGNLNTAKEIIRENILCLQILNKRLDRKFL
jgi:hypothetical protein